MLKKQPRNCERMHVCARLRVCAYARNSCELQSANPAVAEWNEAESRVILCEGTEWRRAQRVCKRMSRALDVLTPPEPTNDEQPVGSIHPRLYLQLLKELSVLIFKAVYLVIHPLILYKKNLHWHTCDIFFVTSCNLTLHRKQKKIHKKQQITIEDRKGAKCRWLADDIAGMQTLNWTQRQTELKDKLSLTREFSAGGGTAAEKNPGEENRVMPLAEQKEELKVTMSNWVRLMWGKGHAEEPGDLGRSRTQRNTKEDTGIKTTEQVKTRIPTNPDSAALPKIHVQKYNFPNFVWLTEA